MNVGEFNAKYEPEWRLTVCRDKAVLDNVVPLYKMVMKIAEWGIEWFTGGKPVPTTKISRDGVEHEFPDYEQLEVPDEVVEVASRVRFLIVREKGSSDVRYFDARTNDQLESAALRALTWLWEEWAFPEPQQPQSPGFTLADVDAALPCLQPPLRAIIEKYIEQRQHYRRDHMVYLDVKKTVEEKHAGGAWSILQSLRLAKVDFLE